MKKITTAVIAALLFASAVTAWGQSASLYSQASKYIFENDVDMALDINGFTQLDNSFTFGTWTYDSSNDMNSGPIEFGLHGTAPFLYTAYGKIFHTTEPAPTNTEKSSVTYTSSTTSVPDPNDPTATTNYSWTSGKVEKDYYRVQGGTIDDSVLFYMPLGKYSIGAKIGYKLVDGLVTGGDGMPRSYKETVTSYYDKTPGQEPTPEEDFTIVTDQDFKDTESTLSLTVPFGAREDESEYSLSLGYTLYAQNNSSESSVTESAHLQAAAAPINRNDTSSTVTDTYTRNRISLSYNSKLPAIFKGHEKNRLEADLWAGASFFSQKYSEADVIQTYTYTPDPTATKDGAATTRQEDTTDRTYKGFMLYNAGASLSHSFYHDLDSSFRVGADPSLSLYYSRYGTATALSGETVVAKRDGNADGKFDNAADTITTTTTTYETPASTADSSFGVNATLPAALEVGLGKLPFSIVVGSSTQVTFSVEGSKTTDGAASTTVVVKQGDGTTVSETTTEAAAPDTSRTGETYWSMSNDMSFGFRIFLPKGATFDFRTYSWNLFDLSGGKFALQLMVPLK